MRQTLIRTKFIEDSASILSANEKECVSTQEVLMDNMIKHCESEDNKS